MTATALMQSIGSTGLFPSRAFIPAFATAMLLRFGNDIPFIKDVGLLASIGSTPTWFTHDITLVVLGLLALLEIVATKVPEAREAMNQIDHYLKTLLAFLTSMGVLGASDRGTLNVIRGADMTGATTDTGLSAAVATAVFWLASLRGSVLGYLHEFDADDHTGLQRVWSWLEDFWVVFGVLLILLYPILMLVVVAILAALLYGLKRYLQYVEEKSKLPCAKCGVPIYPAALSCPSCKTVQAQPRRLGLLGRTTQALVTNRNVHALDLLTHKRCPCCATRLPQRAARQACMTCGHETLSAPATSGEAYLAHINKRLVGVLGVCALLGLVPVLGMIFGILYFRMKLVAPLRQYLPLSTGFVLRGRCAPGICC